MEALTWIDNLVEALEDCGLRGSMSSQELARGYIVCATSYALSDEMAKAVAVLKRVPFEYIETDLGKDLRENQDFASQANTLANILVKKKLVYVMQFHFRHPPLRC